MLHCENLPIFMSFKSIFYCNFYDYAAYRTALHNKTHGEKYYVSFEKQSPADFWLVFERNRFVFVRVIVLIKLKYYITGCVRKIRVSRSGQHVWYSRKSAEDTFEIRYRRAVKRIVSSLITQAIAWIRAIRGRPTHLIRRSDAWRSFILLCPTD